MPYGRIGWPFFIGCALSLSLTWRNMPETVDAFIFSSSFFSGAPSLICEFVRAYVFSNTSSSSVIFDASLELDEDVGRLTGATESLELDDTVISRVSSRCDLKLYSDGVSSPIALFSLR